MTISTFYRGGNLAINQTETHDSLEKALGTITKVMSSITKMVGTNNGSQSKLMPVIGREFCPKVQNIDDNL